MEIYILINICAWVFLDILFLQWRIYSLAFGQRQTLWAVSDQGRSGMNTWWNFKMKRVFWWQFLLKKKRHFYLEYENDLTLCPFSLQLIFWGLFLALSKLTRDCFYKCILYFSQPFMILILKRIRNLFSDVLYVLISLCFCMVVILTFFPFRFPPVS